MLQQALLAHRRGDGIGAEAAYRSVLASEPGNAEANHNLGAILAQRGNTAEALPCFRAAWKAAPAQGQFWISYARALLAEGKKQEAAALLREGQAHGLAGAAVDALLEKAMGGADSRAAGDLVAQGDRCMEAGRHHDAVAAYRQALALAPDLADAHFRLGSVLSESGDIAGGFAHYMRHAALLHGAGQRDDHGPAHRRKHDLEQHAYLAALDPMPAARPFHAGEGARLSGPAVDPANATRELFAGWAGARPQMLVIDRFLTDQALARLRQYCAESTIWRHNYDAGYIGATPADGFACPLLAQIAEEIAAVYQPIIGGHAFRYLGAFKYDSSLSTGTNTHADNAAINVNFYIAPDSANLDPESGGMDIWDVSLPMDEDMARYNRDENLMREFLRRSGAAMTRIPHRANRAVIFRSDLVHKTSPCRFQEGYLNKRINVSLLFGNRAELVSPSGAAGHDHHRASQDRG